VSQNSHTPISSSSLGDYWGYDFFSINASYNDEKSPVQNDPTVDIGKCDDVIMTLARIFLLLSFLCVFAGIKKGLRLAINTAQFGRTFQDRSHMFKILAAPGGGGKEEEKETKPEKKKKKRREEVEKKE
jgi:hypothetical protein